MTKRGKTAAPEKPAARLWPARMGEIRPIQQLKLRDENPRSHSLEQIEQIAESIKRWGWTMPVLVDENDLIIAGHGRVRAARLMGFTEAPVVVAKGWSEEEKRAYVIADNQIAQNSDWDPKRLRAELRALVAADFNLELVGFTDQELSKLTIDAPAAPASTEPTELTMVRCQTCGHLSRKVDQNG